jgi:hypothetical protein
MTGGPYLLAIVSGPGRRAFLSRRARRDWWVPHVYDRTTGQWMATTGLVRPARFATLDDARAAMHAIASTHTAAFVRRLMIVDATTGKPVEMADAR